MRPHFPYTILAAFGLSIFFPSGALAEDPDEWFSKANDEFEEFKRSANEEFASFREKANKEYADFMAQPWKQVKTHEPLKRPELPEPGPIELPEEKDPFSVAPRPVIITETLPEIEPMPRPQPVEPIIPTTVIDQAEPVRMEVYGTYTEVPGIDLSTFRLSGSDSRSFADGWRRLAEPQTDNLIYGCLNVRDKLNLPDWHYFLYVDAVAEALTSKNSNEQVLLQGYILNQSGYDVRFVQETNSGKIHLVFSSEGAFYQRPRYSLSNGWYYAYTRPTGLVTVCDFSTQGEKKLSTAIPSLPKLDFAPGERREISVVKHPDLKLSVTTNRNLIDFFGDYPLAAIGSDEDSRWTAHALVPTSEEIKKEVYPPLRQALQGLNQYDGVNLLLRVAQSFPYEYDEKIWGADRTFFMEESWFYPYSDCEDHAINLVHLVRDLLGLDTAFISYPGHLSAAVAITDGSERGDYLSYKGKKYVVCDATYFYAPAGSTADSYNNASAKLVPLK